MKNITKENWTESLKRHYTYEELNGGLDDAMQSMYLDWTNNFLSVECFAEYYNLSYYGAIQVIEIGRDIHENRVSAA